MIVIVDYGMGNIGAVLNILNHLGIEAVVSSSHSEIETADKLILPGVGSFDHGIESLRSLGLTDTLTRKVLIGRTPILGICLGMQLMTERSEEGGLPGLGWVPGETVRIRFADGQQRLNVPHMGWNSIERCRPGLLLGEHEEDERFYFVHSYHVKCAHEADLLAVTHFGIGLTAAIANDNIFATQFHPEKSHRFGMKVLRNFAGA